MHLIVVRMRRFSREEEAGDQKKEGQKGIPTSGMNSLICLLRSGMWVAGNMIKGAGMCGTGKGKSCRGRKIYFFSCLMFAERKSEVSGFELVNKCIGKLLHYEGI